MLFLGTVNVCEYYQFDNLLFTLIVFTIIFTYLQEQQSTEVLLPKEICFNIMSNPRTFKSRTNKLLKLAQNETHSVSNNV